MLFLDVQDPETFLDPTLARMVRLCSKTNRLGDKRYGRDEGQNLTGGGRLEIPSRRQISDDI